VVKWTTIRLVIALATKLGWDIRQLDIKTAFLNCGCHGSEIACGNDSQKFRTSTYHYRGPQIQLPPEDGSNQVESWFLN
jgi:hypothetical protein